MKTGLKVAVIIILVFLIPLSVFFSIEAVTQYQIISQTREIQEIIPESNCEATLSYTHKDRFMGMYGAHSSCTNIDRITSDEFSVLKNSSALKLENHGWTVTINTWSELVATKGDYVLKFWYNYHGQTACTHETERRCQFHTSISQHE